MIEAAEVVRAYLLTVNALTALTADRIWGEQLYPPTNYRPYDGGALLFQSAGGGIETANTILRTRWQFKCYGPDITAIRAVSRALMDALSDTRGRGQILSSQPQAPGTLLEEPRTNWPFMLVFIETTIFSGLPLYTPQ